MREAGDNEIDRVEVMTHSQPSLETLSEEPLNLTTSSTQYQSNSEIPHSPYPTSPSRDSWKVDRGLFQVVKPCIHNK